MTKTILLMTLIIIVMALGGIWANRSASPIKQEVASTEENALPTEKPQPATETKYEKETPRNLYTQMHVEIDSVTTLKGFQALLSKYLSKEGIATMQASTPPDGTMSPDQEDAVLKLILGFLPKSKDIVIVKETINGNKATLQLSSSSATFGSVHATANYVMEDGRWKLTQPETWTNK